MGNTVGREAWAVIAALAAHAAFLRVASEVSPENRLLHGLAAVEPLDVEIETEPVAATPARAVAPSELVPPTPAPEPVRHTDAAPTRGALAARATSPANEAPPSVPDPAATAPTGELAAPGEAGVAGVGASLPRAGTPGEYGDADATPMAGPSQPVWALLPGLVDSRAPAAPTEAPRATAVQGSTADKVLSASLRGRDKEVGIDLPATQIVVGAVSTAVRSTGATHNTRATFEVKIGPGGTVTSARLVSASGGDERAWDGATKALAASLRGRKLDLGAAASTGATVRVSTTTRHVFPAGTAKAADVKPVCANQIINDIADATSTRPTPKDGEAATVPLFTDEHGRPCIPVGVAGISDAANLGAQKQIQVLTQATVQVDGQSSLPLELPTISKDPIWIKPTEGSGPRPVLPYKLRKRLKDKEKKK